MQNQAVKLQKECAEPRGNSWAPACAIEGCRRSAEASFHQSGLCVQHFIFACYVRLDKCKKHAWVSDPGAKQSADLGFLIAAAEQSLRLFEHGSGFDNLDRARLYDIHLWASDLLAHRDLSAASFTESIT